ncbi:casein kinase 2 regulatory subunit CKB1 [Sugiyamaella lignohabitans]|uniref:Casein kinase II subunit beta n=1 Tax=Sugiyamaella lignohabitans TaxID=796027 RepID=A0A167EXP6_9ASCO|nr:casein kinase 2 regulatory subunit CKB1 [Sugiyamaella lignohabitans]ANB14581.1 casein kinase 2 regulatory subunit CKB1 [Sugiyamaella lignohabitans]
MSNLRDTPEKQPQRQQQATAAAAAAFRQVDRPGASNASASSLASSTKNASNVKREPTLSSTQQPPSNIEEDEEEEEEEEEIQDGTAGATGAAGDKYNFMFDESDDASSGSLDFESWIKSFCSIVGHEFFAEVSEEFIEDDFNLTGLGPLIPHYKEALELILDLEPETPPKLPTIPIIEQSAEQLYGMIHARFILSRPGLQIMAQKFHYQQFGTCPRYFCHGTGLLPVGRHDMPGFETVRLYCPCCMDIYVPPNSRFLSIDGAFFGTSFPGLFLKAYPEIEKECARRRKQQGQFELTIYGFKIAESSKSGSRMKWLRQVPVNDSELDEHVSEIQDGARSISSSSHNNPTNTNDNESMMSISMNGET